MQVHRTRITWIRWFEHYLGNIIKYVINSVVDTCLETLFYGEINGSKYYSSTYRSWLNVRFLLIIMYYKYYYGIRLI